jgi:hypothetical protein
MTELASLLPTTARLNILRTGVAAAAGDYGSRTSNMGPQQEDQWQQEAIIGAAAAAGGCCRRSSRSR